MLNLLKYELIVSMSTEINGICGHTYEMIEYFFILNKHFKCCLLIPEFEIYDNLKNILHSKYDFTNDEVSNILQHTYNKSNQSKVLGNNMLLTDGIIDNNINKHYIIKKVFLFSCQIRDFNTKHNFVVLADNRIYDFGTHYTKKILLDRIKPPRKKSTNMLIYATQDCRDLEQEYYDFIAQKYFSFDFTLLTNRTNKPNVGRRFNWIDMPVDNVFEHFGTYLYTKTSTQFDCSPRFIVECKYFYKEVIYDIDYNDIGLETRKYDIEHNFNSLHLREDDDLINILKEHI
jgi:hypothetical protein